MLVELAVKRCFEVCPLTAGCGEGGGRKEGRGCGGETCVGVEGAELVLEFVEREFFLSGAVLKVLVKYHESIIIMSDSDFYSASKALAKSRDNQ